MEIDIGGRVIREGDKTRPSLTSYLLLTHHYGIFQVGGLDFLRVAVMPDQDTLDARERESCCCALVWGLFIQASSCPPRTPDLVKQKHSGAGPAPDDGDFDLPDGGHQGHGRPPPLHHVRFALPLSISLSDGMD